MAYEPLRLSVRDNQLRGLKEIAQAEDVSIAQVVRDAIDRELWRRQAELYRVETEDIRQDLAS